MTVHDLRRYALPELYRESKLEYFETAVKKADHFLAVSESTKTDLCKFFNIPEQKVDVAHLATNLAEMELSDKRKDQAKKYISEHLGLEADNYLVTLSSPDQRKNIRRTVEAFGHAQSQLPGNMKLLIIGQLPKRETQFVEDLNAGKYKNVVCPGPVDELWPWLVCAKALVFASLYEGFGIPILEAFSCQLPVITSQCSSMPEVAGDAAVYVDPHNTDSIAQAIIKVCGDSDLRESLIQKGKIRNADFSWKKTAQKTIEAYQKLL